MTTPRWSSLMLDGQLPALAEQISTKTIMTPVDQLVTVEPTSNVAEALEKMGETFDQLPVVKQSRVFGMVFRQDLQASDGDACIDNLYRPISSLDSVRSNESVWDSINHLCGHHACVVFDVSTGDFCGLLHYADLNRQAVRVFCYLWTSALEMSMAELLVAVEPDHMKWVESLDQHRQVQILGRHAYGQRQNIELSPVEGLELSDLLNIWRKQSRLLSLVELSQPEFKKRTNHLVELRHAAMHPVRSLVTQQSDVATLKNRLEDLRFLVRKTIAAIQNRRGEERQA